ncbi:MAG: glycosyltransferase [Rhodospirillales bacterium]|nr:glycosyltransferase [Rhodospirillales bacterium]
MKILQIMAGADVGGAELFFERLCMALAKRNSVEQQVIIRQNPNRRQRLEAGGVAPIELKFGGRLDWQTPRAIRRQIKTFKPDIVLTWMNRATAMCPKPKNGEFIHIARLGGYYDLKYYQGCDHLIGNTKDIADYLVKEGWPAGKAHYLPNFVSAEQAAPIGRRGLYTPDGAPLILALGRLHENKAFDILLQAMARVPSAYLWIAGEGPLLHDLDKLAEKLAVKPRVRFLGWRDDAAALLQTADLFVCPSRHEPLGNTVIEAWAQNTPVVAADSFGPGTLITHLHSGVLVPIDDPPTMARAIKNVIEDPVLAARIVKNGRAEYEARFTEDIVTGQYLAFFQKVLEPCAASPV